MRIRSLCVMLLAGLVVAGCDSDCPTPTSPTSPTASRTVESLTITGPSQLQVGQTAQLTATARYSDGSTENVTTTATWVTNNVNLCTITTNGGLLTAVSAGTCTITAVINNISGTHTVTCFFPGNPGDPNPPTGPPNNPNPPPTDPPTSFGLRIDGASQVGIGAQIQLRAFRTDNNQEVTDQAQWGGSNSGVATVGSAGRVTGVAVGALNVSASFDGRTASAPVIVICVSNCPPPPCPPNCPPPPCPPNCPPTPGVTLQALSIQGVTSVQAGQTSQLQAIATLSDGTTPNVTTESQWSSGNAGIAPVNGTGLVTGAAAGTSPITARYTLAGVTKEATVNFVVSSGPPQPPTVNSLTVSGTSPLTVGQTSQYNAVANLSDGTNPNVNGQAQWSSSNPGVASVGSTGIVTAVSAGTTTITATYQGRSGSVPLTVNAAPVQREIIGLRAQLDANILTGGGGLVNLNLLDLLSDPILDLKVYALYNDGSEQDVTSLVAIERSTPLLRVDAPGVVNLVDLLVRALLDPNHYIVVRYGGYTVRVDIRINVGNLTSLPILGINLPNLAGITAGTKLPNVTALLSGGLQLIVPSDTPGLNWVVAPRGLLGGLLAGLGRTLGDVLGVVNGTLRTTNLGILNPILALLGGVLTVDINAVIGSVSSAVQGINVPL